MNKIFLAEKAVKNLGILENLRDYSPTPVSTIFVELNTKESDIDIVCSYQQQDAFAALLNDYYSTYESYNFQKLDTYVIAQFKYSDFLFEIYASTIPVPHQYAYRHYRIMQQLAKCGGENFRKKIRLLKETGLKTEPAICSLFGFTGDPFDAVLQLESYSELEIKELISKIKE